MTIRSTRRRGADDGFGLVEVIIAMSLLMVIAVAMLPVFINSLRLSSTTVSVTTATQIVSEQMDLARSIAPTCDAVQQFAEETLGRIVEDPRGVILEITMVTPATCPTPGTYPAAFLLQVEVREQGTTEIIAEAETRILITSES